MDGRDLMLQARTAFEGIKRTRPDGSEYWSARDLQFLLGYEKWERFEDAIDRAKAACQNSNQDQADHFPGAGKMVPIGSGTSREVPDHHLTRYAGYLVAMNGDPRKPEIAAAQTYFAVQTARQEKADAITPPTQGQLLVAMAQAYETHERRLLELAAVQATTQNQVQELAVQVNGITARQQEAADELTALPTPEGVVAGLSWRARLNRLVRSFCLENSYGHQSAWSRLYLEYRDRYHVDLKARTHGKKTALDVAEEMGITEQLYNLAHKIFVVGE